MTNGPATPFDPGERIAELDALRGLAVIGIVLMNVFAFAMPGAAYFNPVAWGGDGPLELGLWSASFLVEEDKFRGLFAMMFGAGVAIQLDRSGPGRLRAHYARMAALFAIGFVHALLLSSADVLRLYAIVGLVLPLCVRWPARRLWLAAILLVAMYYVAAGYIAWGWVEYWWRVETVAGTDPAPLAPAEAAFGADPAALERGLAVGRESLGERIERRLEAPLSSLLAGLVFLPTTLAAMLAGVALWRTGLLAARWAPPRALRLAARLAAASLPPLALLAALAIRSDFHGAVIGTNALVWSAPFDLLLAIACGAAAMAWFQRRGPADAVVRRLAATGRLALSNYLATSVILGAIYQSWGLGLFGATGRAEAYLIALIPIVAMLAWSPWWLRRFRHGPAEWFWRSLSQARGLPLRRQPAD